MGKVNPTSNAFEVGFFQTPQLQNATLLRIWRKLSQPGTFSL